MAGIDNIGNGSSGSFDATPAQLKAFLDKNPEPFAGSSGAPDIMLEEVEIEGHNNSLVYPVDVGTHEFYPEAIKFTPYKRHSASLENVLTAMEGAWAEFGDLTSKTISKHKVEGEDYYGSSGFGLADDHPINQKNQAMASVEAVQKGEKSEGALKHMKTVLNYIRTQTYAGEIYEGIRLILNAATSGLRQPPPGAEGAEMLKPAIFLNMPNEISFAEPIAWDGTTELGMLGAMAKSDSSISAGALANIGNMVGGGAGMLAGMLAKHSTGILKGLGPMSGALLGTLGGGTTQRMFESSFGNIANPYKEMTFTGIGFREFAFNFVFRARSSTEVLMIQSIIQHFRFHSKPTAIDGGSVLNYPDEFMIEFLVKAEPNRKSYGKETVNDRFKTNPYIPQLKMCVCKSVNTNFTSQNTWRTLKSGAPVEISLALTFEETELVDSNDVLGDTSFGRFAGSGRKF